MPTGGTVNRKFAVRFFRSASRLNTPPFSYSAFFLAVRSNLKQGWYNPTKLWVLGLAIDTWMMKNDLHSYPESGCLWINL
jgi:hypothetical protein